MTTRLSHPSSVLALAFLAAIGIGTVLLMLILGGIGTLRGAVLGAFLFVVLKELFQSEALFGAFAKHWQLPLGLTIIACVALMPNGVVGLPAQLRRSRVPVPHAG